MTSRTTKTIFANKLQEWKQVVAIIVMVCGVISAVILWATNSHAEIKDWTSEQDFVTKKELREAFKESYVPKHEFATVKEKLDNQAKNQQRLMDQLDKIDRKLDKMQRKLNR